MLTCDPLENVQKMKGFIMLLGNQNRTLGSKGLRTPSG